MTNARTIDGELVKTSLQKILESDTFSRSERLRAFIDYVVRKEQEGLGHQLKGYTIGVDVFSRTESFDPGGDPLVRVQAGKLRKLLRQYYATEGACDELRIEIPVGTYVPSYIVTVEDEVVEENIAPAPMETAVDIAAVDARSSNWTRFRFASTSLLAVTVLNITALGLHATSRYLVPASNTAISGHSSIVREASALPRVTIANRDTKSAVAASLADSLRVAASQLASVELVDDFDQANAIARQASQLDFTISIAKAEKPGDIVLSLRHNATGRIVHSEQIAEENLRSLSERTYAASSFAGRGLTMSGQLYAFAEHNDYSSRLMRCMSATYEYRLQRSRQSFQAAWGCQSELVPSKDAGRFISELHSLTSMAQEAEAQRRAETDA